MTEPPIWAANSVGWGGATERNGCVCVCLCTQSNRRADAKRRGWKIDGVGGRNMRDGEGIGKLDPGIKKKC